MLIIIIVALSFWCSGLLYAAMSDSSAMTAARKLYGSIAMIDQIRGPSDTYWTKRVGVMSPGCRNNPTVLGQAQNTWDAAFAAIPVSAVLGPYRSVILLSANAWDNDAVAGFQFILDGLPLGQQITQTPAPTWSVTLNWDTTLVTNGVHVLCAQATDRAGNMGQSNAMVILVDQTKLPVSTTLQLAQAAGGSPVIFGSGQ